MLLPSKVGCAHSTFQEKSHTAAYTGKYVVFLCAATCRKEGGRENRSESLQPRWTALTCLQFGNLAIMTLCAQDFPHTRGEGGITIRRVKFTLARCFSHRHQSGVLTSLHGQVDSSLISPAQNMFFLPFGYVRLIVDLTTASTSIGTRIQSQIGAYQNVRRHNAVGRSLCNANLFYLSNALRRNVAGYAQVQVASVKNTQCPYRRRRSHPPPTSPRRNSICSQPLIEDHRNARDKQISRKVRQLKIEEQVILYPSMHGSYRTWCSCIEH